MPEAAVQMRRVCQIGRTFVDIGKNLRDIFTRC
jgi:hypothetical protein